MIFVIIRTIAETGWYLSNPRLGAPGGMHLHDYPGADNLCCLILKGFTLLTNDPFLIRNVFLLLTFALAAASATAVLQLLSVGRLIALVGGVLYSLLPYHFYRAGVGHLFLTAYFLVPLVVLIGIVIAAGPESISRRGPIRLSSPLGSFSIAVCVLLGFNMVYYPFFGCFLLLVSAGLACAARRDHRAAVFALALIGIVTLTVVLNHVPTLVHLAKRTSTTFVSRFPGGSEVYALKLTQLLLPIAHHRIPAFAALTRNYEKQYPLVNENKSAALGLAGSCGLMILLGTLIFGQRRHNAGREDALVLPTLARFNAAALLLATIGGFSSLVALLVIPHIRGYNRITPFIAFFCLAALCLYGEQLRRRFAVTRARSTAFGALCIVIMVAGVLDQVNAPGTAHRMSRDSAAAEAHQRFYADVERELSPGSMIFQLPYMPFPETGPVHQLPEYTPFIPYLYTASLRWSYGAIKGTPPDLWQQDVVSRPVAEFLRRIALAGFRGVLLDRRGFEDHGRRWEADLTAHASAVRKHPEGHVVFFGLSEYVDRLKQSMSAAQWQEEATKTSFVLRLEWGGGFSAREGSDEANWRWCSESGWLAITSDSPAPRTVRIHMTATSADLEPVNLAVRSSFWKEDILLNSGGVVIDRTVTIPSGTHQIAFRCDGKPAVSPDARRLVWRIDNFRIE